MTADPGSYRDPSGHVHIVGDRVFRTVTPHGQAEYKFVRDSGALTGLIERGLLIAATEVENTNLASAGPDDLLLKHPKIPIISYPYEWPFAALKAAALLHLDIQLELLEHDVALSDASAFNIQFIGGKPQFIDYLSFRRYREDEPWLAHRQFCQQFLNPLVLQAKLGVPFHAWFRGQPEGIEIGELASLLKFRHKLSPVLFSHVVLLARLQGRVNESDVAAAQAARTRGLKRSRFRAILEQLRHFIAGLSPAGVSHTTWGHYATDNTYESAEASAKHAFVERFAADARPGLLIDLGCNTGDYSHAALAHGARRVVGLDGDHGALDGAFARATTEDLDFLPLYQDLANPTPGLGWNARERQGLGERLAAADGVLALAVIHHLAIARNVPLEEVVSSIVSMAPKGVIEFVPKDDPTVQTMLALREDVFATYSRESFMAALENRAEIVAHETVSTSGRELFYFSRR
jgi:ribosomal protein L11 methylase PrmA